MRTAHLALIVIAALIAVGTAPRGFSPAPVAAAPQGAAPPTVTQHLTIAAQHLISQREGCISHFPAVDGGVSDSCRYWIAPVHLPDGSVVTRMDVVYEDNSSTGNAVFDLAEAPLDGSFDGDAGFRFDSPDAGTPGKETVTLTGTTPIDNTAFHYHLEVTLDDPDTKFYSAVLTYQSPLPGIPGPMANGLPEGSLAQHSAILAASGLIAKTQGCPPIADWSGATGADGCTEWEAPLYLPDGAVVTRVDMHYGDTSAATLTASLNRTDLAGTANEQLGNYRLDGDTTGPGSHLATATGSATVDNTQFAYNLEVLTPDAGTIFNNVVITYTPPPPNADINCSGTITLGDAIGIARYLVSLPVDQAAGCPEIGVAPAAAQAVPQGAAIPQHLVINSQEVVSKIAGCPATNFAGGTFTQGTCTSWAAPIHLPDCAVILKVEMYYRDGSDPNRVETSINFGHVNGNTDSLSEFDLLSEDSADVASTSDSGFLLIDNSEQSYYLFVQTPDDDVHFMSALITYDANVELFPGPLGDVDGNSTVNLGDAINIARYLVGLTPSVPVSCT